MLFRAAVAAATCCRSFSRWAETRASAAEVDAACASTTLESSAAHRETHLQSAARLSMTDSVHFFCCITLYLSHDC